MNNLIVKQENDRIDLICQRYNIKNYSINPDGSIDVDGNVDFGGMDLLSLPLRFGKVSGHFECYKSKLSSLEGGPKTVGGHFGCDFNQLTTLVGAPTVVGGSFYCTNNVLSSLEGLPGTIGGDFNCSYNQLTTLNGVPSTINGVFSCFHNMLTSTHSGDTDIEVSGALRCDGKFLPQLYRDNISHIKLILKYQRHFMVWNEDLTLNEENFQVLLDEINDGLR